MSTTLVVNAGSSTLKLSWVESPGVVARRRLVDPWSGEDLTSLADFVAEVGEPDAVGHRIVHGGLRHRAPTLVDDDVLAYLRQIEDLAPLHNPPAVAAAEGVARLLPWTPAVGVFDTAFHADLPAAAATYALPRIWNQRWGIRRFGFHGISHAYAARRAAELMDRPLAGLRIVTCHLGAGASLCAVVDGASVDTTMGFTPDEGLVMQTRSGTVDPGLLLWLVRRQGVDVDTVARVLEHDSGLRGLSGTSGDLRAVLSARASGDVDAALAFDVLVHRLACSVGAMAVSAGGLDALVFTGGMAEHSPELRRAAAARLASLGVAVDPVRDRAGGDREISTQEATVRTFVVAAQEDVQVASEVWGYLDQKARAVP